LAVFISCLAFVHAGMLRRQFAV